MLKYLPPPLNGVPGIIINRIKIFVEIIIVVKLLLFYYFIKILKKYLKNFFIVRKSIIDMK